VGARLRPLIAVMSITITGMSLFVAAARESPPRRPVAVRAGNLFLADLEARATSTPVSQPADSRSDTWVSQAYPHQSRATQDPRDPATFYWALLIGINDYASPTRDNVGSRQDAQSLYDFLTHHRWHSDHIMLMTDRTATASHVLSAIRWLAGKTDTRSIVVFLYAGHGVRLRNNADYDHEKQDVALWLSDNKLIIDGTLGKELGRVRAARMWIDFATCRAGGFDDPGMVKPGRVITYSSPQREYSYEDPNLHHSVFGYYVIVQAIGGVYGDQNHDGEVSVEEAFYWARDRVVTYTSGRQHPFIRDSLKGEFDLEAPPKPRPSPPPSPQPTCLLVCLP
jgi:caspase domain-containing protein